MNGDLELRDDDHGQPGKRIEEVNLLPDGSLEYPVDLRPGEVNWLTANDDGDLIVRVFRGFNPDEVARWAKEHGYKLVKRETK